jgi:hypothetical protein
VVLAHEEEVRRRGVGLYGRVQVAHLLGSRSALAQIQDLGLHGVLRHDEVASQSQVEIHVLPRDEVHRTQEVEEAYRLGGEVDGKDHPYRVHGESRVRVPILAVVPEVFLGAFHGEVVCRGEEEEEDICRLVEEDVGSEAFQGEYGSPLAALYSSCHHGKVV